MLLALKVQSKLSAIREDIENENTLKYCTPFMKNAIEKGITEDEDLLKLGISFHEQQPEKEKVCDSDLEDRSDEATEKSIIAVEDSTLDMDTNEVNNCFV